MKIEIIETEPTGNASIQHAIEWMRDVSKAVDDAKDLWKQITPNIKKSASYEFSQANPNAWWPLTKNYVRWKIGKDYPSTIGVRTGALKEAASYSAVVDYSNKFMVWGVNPDIVGGKWGDEGEAVGEYMNNFDEGRPLFGWTLKFIDNIVIAAVKKFVKKITEKLK